MMALGIRDGASVVSKPMVWWTKGIGRAIKGRALDKNRSPAVESWTKRRKMSSGFRQDLIQHSWQVKQIRKTVHHLDIGFEVSFSGKYGLPTRGPRPESLRAALRLVDDGVPPGEYPIDSHLLVTINGTGEDDTVDMLEGPRDR